MLESRRQPGTAKITWIRVCGWSWFDLVSLTAVRWYPPARQETEWNGIESRRRVPD